MFAYCGNDPVIYQDAGGARYTTFNEAEAGGFVTINGQGNEPWNSIPFGLSTLEKSGCGVIAIYNAMGLYGEYKSLDSVRDYFQDWWRARYFGVFPSEIGGYLDANNISYTKASTTENLSSSMSDGSIAIITFWNETYLTYGLDAPTKTVLTRRVNIFGGAHTVAVKCVGSKYTIYNLWNNVNGPKDIYNINTFMEKRGFICGYVLE